MGLQSISIYNNLIVKIEINRIFYISTKRGGRGGGGAPGFQCSAPMAMYSLYKAVHKGPLSFVGGWGGGGKGSKNPLIGLSQKKNIQIY